MISYENYIRIKLTEKYSTDKFFIWLIPRIKSFSLSLSLSLSLSY